MNKISRCKSCGEEIVWLKTKSNYNIPVDYETGFDMSAEIFDSKTMVSHFATCKDAGKWRKK